MPKLLFLIVLSVLILSAQGSAADAPPATFAQALEGNWAGEMTVESGKRLAGKPKGETIKYKLSLSFDKQGKLTGGEAMGGFKLVEGTVKDWNPVTIQTYYSIGSSKWVVGFSKGQFDPKTQTLTGAFSNVMGAGSFTLTKQGGAAPAPDAKK